MHMCSPHRALSVAALLLSTLSVGCADEIGDDCETALDCSAQGTRECDRTQRGGYCTIRGCEKGTCPEEAVCVKFRPQEPRLAVSYCMFKCSARDDCRSGYSCLSSDTFGAGDSQDAIVLDGNKKFCAQQLSPGMMSELPDAGIYTPDDDAGLSYLQDDAGSE